MKEKIDKCKMSTVDKGLSEEYYDNALFVKNYLDVELYKLRNRYPELFDFGHYQVRIIVTTKF